VTSPAKLAIGVMARAPVPGRCKKNLAEVLGAAGAARLYAAMLRDTLEARSRIPAVRYVVLVAPEDGGVAELRAIVPAPWEVLAQNGATMEARLAHALSILGDGGGSVVLMDGDAPTVSASGLAKALHSFGGGRRALLGPCNDGACYLLGVTTVDLALVQGAPKSTKDLLFFARSRFRELGLDVEELPTAYDVEHPPALERLRVELAAHPERAPRTAQYLRDNPP
jgi:glycosyltransferase A (GT-A) superfamily protein (DUF2064 family)